MDDDSITHAGSNLGFEAMFDIFEMASDTGCEWERRTKLKVGWNTQPWWLGLDGSTSCYTFKDKEKKKLNIFDEFYG